MTKHIFGKLSEHIGHLTKKDTNSKNATSRLPVVTARSIVRVHMRQTVNYAEASGSKHLVVRTENKLEICADFSA